LFFCFFVFDYQNPKPKTQRMIKISKLKNKSKIQNPKNKDKLTRC